MSAVVKEKDSAGTYECPPLLKRFQDRIEANKDDHEKRTKEWEKNREYSSGKQHDDGAKGLVRTNLIYVNQATIIPHTYAKNPEIAVSPSKAVDERRYATVKKFASSLEIVLDRMFIKDTFLKKRMRSSLHSVYNTGEGWLKMFYQRDYATDPVIKARIHDAQDNLERLERLLRLTKDGNDSKQHEADRDELKVMLESLQNQVEVVIQEGLVVDRVLSEDMMILDPTLTDFDMYLFADSLCQSIWMTKTDYEEQFQGWPEHGAPSLFRSRKDKQQPGSASEKAEDLVCVRELWNLRTNTVFTFGDGAKAWAREPYQPQKTPERWYPFYRLGWNFLDASAYALPDVSTQRELQDEYNRSRTQWADAREESRPVRLVRGSGSLTQEDLDNIKNRKSRDLVVVNGKPGSPLQDDLGELPPIPVDPAVYDTTPIRGDMEMVSGRGDASTGGMIEAKTATEASIMQQALVSRSDYRRDNTEDMLAEMAKAASEMLLQELTVQQVEYLAGTGAVWPQMAKHEVFNLVNIEIRAGSTQKPNQAQEQERWTTLLPIIKETVMTVSELQAQGNLPLAETLRKILKETLRRFDERMDLEDLMGPEGQEGQAQAQQMASMQQQVMELQQALQQAQEQLAAFDQQKMAKEQQDAEARQHERTLKEREYEDRKAERAAAMDEKAMRAQEEERRRAEDAANREAESASKVQITRDGWDREDDRAREEREFQKEQRALEQQLESLKQMVSEQLGKITQRADEVTNSPMPEVAGLLMDEIKKVEAQLSAAEQARQHRTQIITQYLKGPRDDKALNDAVQNLVKGDK